MDIMKYIHFMMIMICFFARLYYICDYYRMAQANKKKKKIRVDFSRTNILKELLPIK